MSGGAIVLGDLAELECLVERETDGQTHVVVRDAREHAPQVAIGWVFIGIGVAGMLLGLAVENPIPSVLGFPMVPLGIAGVIVNLRRHGAITIDRRETRVRAGGQDVSEPTARIRAFGVSKPLRWESPSVVIFRVDDSVVPTLLTFASEARAQYVAGILNAALSPARRGGTGTET
jgi:hypothetical protein